MLTSPGSRMGLSASMGLPTQTWQTDQRRANVLAKNDEEATFGFSAGMESHFGGQECTAVSQTGPHTVSAGQRR